MRLDEVLSRIYPYEWEAKLSDTWIGVFKTESGKAVELGLSESSDGIWDISFSTESPNNPRGYKFTTGITGDGEPFGIFSTVIAMITEFVNQVDPEGFYFTAAKDDHPGGSESRVRLYRQMLKRFAAKYEITEFDRNNKIRFSLRKKYARV